MSARAPQSELFVVEGDVDHAAFPGWIGRHARKLGIACGPTEWCDGALRFRASGAPDMLDALEMACSLGPIVVQVHRVERETLTN